MRFLKTIILATALVLVVCVSFAAVPAPRPIPTSVPTTDLSYQSIARLVGSGWESFDPLVATPRRGMAGVIIGLLDRFNKTVLAGFSLVFCFMVFQRVVLSVVETRGDLKDMFGSNLMGPVRCVIGLAMLMSTPSGLNAMQIATLVGTHWSIEKANGLWTFALNGIINVPISPQPPSTGDPLPGVERMALQIVRAQTAQAYKLLAYDSARFRQGAAPKPEPWLGELTSATSGVVPSDTYQFLIMGVELPGFFSAVASAWGRGQDTAPHSDLDFMIIEQQCQDSKNTTKDPVCEPRKQAVLQLIRDLRPFALYYAHLNGPDEFMKHTDLKTQPRTEPTPAAVKAVIDSYQTSVKAAQTDGQARLDDRHNASTIKFQNQARDEGWLTAGGHFVRIQAVRRSIDHLVNNVPRMKLAFADSRIERNQTFDGLAEVVDTTDEHFRQFLPSIAPASVNDTNGKGGKDGDERILEKVFKLVAEALGETPLRGLTAALASDDPLSSLTTLGTTFKTAAMTVFTMGAVGGTATGLLSDVGGQVLVFTAFAFASAIMGIAFTLAYYLPAIPMILWLTMVIFWLLKIIECMVAAPLWAAAHALPGEKGFMGSAKTGYMMFAHILLTPVLMIMALTFSIAILGIVGHIVNAVFQAFITGTKAGYFTGWIGPIDAIFLFIIFLMLFIQVIHQVFGLIGILPNKVLGWMGQLIQPMGVRAEQTRVEQMSQQAAATTAGVGAGVQRKMMSARKTQGGRGRPKK